MGSSIGGSSLHFGDSPNHLPALHKKMAQDLKGFLNPNDPVAISFWIISIAMVASTVFFLWEANCVDYHWKTSMHVGSLVTLVAAVHYFYMREFWVQIGSSPIVYRYMGEVGFLEAWTGFIIGLSGWGFILFEIFKGEAGSVAATGEKVSEHVKESFAIMRFIVTAGWSISPLGYFFGYLLGQVNDGSLNLVYNLADFINKIAFCLAIWASAKKDTAGKQRR